MTGRAVAAPPCPLEPAEDDAVALCVEVMRERFGRVTFSEEEARILIRELMVVIR